MEPGWLNVSVLIENLKLKLKLKATLKGKIYAGAGLLKVVGSIYSCWGIINMNIVDKGLRSADLFITAN